MDRDRLWAALPLVGVLALAGVAAKAEEADLFARYASQGYQEVAAFAEGQGGDPHVARHFARRAELAAAGSLLRPQPVTDWRLPPETAVEAEEARQRLLAALDAGARSRAPYEAAVAQVNFECWLPQFAPAAEGQPSSEDCRQRFYTALAELQQALPAAALAAAPPVPSEEEVLLEDILDRDTGPVWLGPSPQTALAPADIPTGGGDLASPAGLAAPVSVSALAPASVGGTGGGEGSASTGTTVGDAPAGGTPTPATPSEDGTPATGDTPAAGGTPATGDTPASGDAPTAGGPAGGSPEGDSNGDTVGGEVGVGGSVGGSIGGSVDGSAGGSVDGSAGGSVDGSVGGETGSGESADGGVGGESDGGAGGEGGGGEGGGGDG